MKLDSKYFDMIRIKSGSRQEERKEPEAPVCQWKGCTRAGKHRAPMGRDREGEFYLFCQEHIRQFNASYNYFEGMSDAEVEDFRKDATYGHRPTWKAGENAFSGGRRTAAVRGRFEPG